MTYEIKYTRTASRALASGLPSGVASAALMFIRGDLAANPRRVGKPLREPMEGLHSARRGSYRIVYEIREEPLLVVIVRVEHRRDAYRT